MEKLQEITKRRRIKTSLMEKDGDRSHQILANLYSNPTHFFMELIQNAEDENAENIKFTLEKDKLIFTHDSPNYFTLDDIESISNFGDNEKKKEKPNMIGRFGIGFKSVYAITDKPRIISAEYDITIENYNVPVPSNNSHESYFQGTKIILPFKKEMEKKIHEILYKELKHLNINYLLFLTSVKEIDWIAGDEKGKYRRDVQKNNIRYVKLQSPETSLKYYLLTKNIDVDNKILTLKMAIQLDDENNFIPCDASPLFVFSPPKSKLTLIF